MDKLSGNENSKIYIVNSDYRIVSCNEELKKTFPELECGQICYEALCGEEEPCRECPVARKARDNAVSTIKRLRNGWRSIPVPLTGRGRSMQYGPGKRDT